MEPKLMDCELFAYSIPKLYGDQMTTDFSSSKGFQIQKVTIFSNKSFINYINVLYIANAL